MYFYFDKKNICAIINVEIKNKGDIFYGRRSKRRKD